MRRWLQEPLLHFLLAGGLLFAAYAWLNPGAGDGPRVVRISAAEVDWLRETWSRQWSRQPDEQELRGLVSAHLKEKLLEREARELGLELDDTVVRRRLAQKMEFLVNDAATLADPNEEELRRLYDESRGLYLTPARISFTQIPFRDRAAALQGLEELKLRDAAELGDPSLLARDYQRVDAQAVSGLFGPEFASALFALEPGPWRGPLVSPYGTHLVRISEQRAARQQPFAAVREQVESEWRRIRQEQARERYFARLLEKYDLVMDEGVASLLGPLDQVVR